MGQLVRAVAAGRKAKALFKTLSKVHVRFNPFDPSAITAREFLKRVRTPPVLKENPGLQVSADVVEEYGNPSIDLTYTDGHTQNIAPAGSTIVELIDEVERVARWKADGVQNPFEHLRAREAVAKN